MAVQRESETLGSREVAEVAAVHAKDCEHVPGWVELLHALVERVGHVHVAIGVHRERARGVHAVAVEVGRVVQRGVEPHGPVAAVVDHPHVAGAVHAHVIGVGHAAGLPLHGAGGGVQLDHAVVLVVRHEQVAA